MSSAQAAQIPRFRPGGNGNVYAADSGNNVIREIITDATGASTVSTIAGDGVAGTTEGPARSAKLDGPYGITVAPGGILLVSDNGTTSGDLDSVRMLVPAGSQLTTPPPGPTFIGTTVRFGWKATIGATGYSLSLGSQPGGSDLYLNASIPSSSISEIVSGIAVDGRTIYAELKTEISGNVWLDPGPVVYTAATDQLALTLSPSTVAPGGAYWTELTVDRAIQGWFTMKVYLSVPPICYLFRYCTVSLAELESTETITVEPCPIGAFCFPYLAELAAPTPAGSYFVTVTLTPAGGTVPVSVTKTLTVE